MQQLTKAGMRLAASLPDDWVAPLIKRIAADNQIRHVRVAARPKPSRSAPARSSAACARSRYGRNRAAHLHRRDGDAQPAPQIPVFCIVSQRGSIDDHASIRRCRAAAPFRCSRPTTIRITSSISAEEIEHIPDAYEDCRLQKRPFVLFLTHKLVKGTTAA